MKISTFLTSGNASHSGGTEASAVSAGVENCSRGNGDQPSATSGSTGAEQGEVTATENASEEGSPGDEDVATFSSLETDTQPAIHRTVTKIQTLSSLLQQYPALQTYNTIKNGKSRIHAVCTLCKKYIDVAQRASKNGSVPIANGIRADGDDRVKQIAQHMESEIHKACIDKKQLDEAWEKGTDDHPWLRVLKAHDARLLNFLVSLAFDVYNDSLYETISAYSWPARSLTTMAASRMNSAMNDEKQAATFSEFKPVSADLQYRNPV